MIALPQGLLEIIREHGRFEFHADGTPSSISAPRPADILMEANKYRPSVHNSSDDIHEQAAKDFMQWIPKRLKLQLEYIKKRPARAPGVSSGTDIPEPIVEGDGDASPCHAAVWWEATVKSMKTAALLELCDANAISVERHPTNPGLTAMRSRNALYVALRRGVQLKEAK